MIQKFIIYDNFKKTFLSYETSLSGFTVKTFEDEFVLTLEKNTTN